MILKKLFGSANDRYIKKLQHIVDKINALEVVFEPLTDDELRAKTTEFKGRLTNGETLDDLLPEAFAVVREAAKRTLGQRHFDVQLIGGMVLHRGQIAEMKTGEGKTLVATLAAYLNALTGKGVHIITVNDYLAKRDSEWMGQVYRFLGLTVSCVVQGLDNEARKQAYLADITYGTNSEFGFDYLRDNTRFASMDQVQRPFNYAIVDEVDSILIDEARTPLIISGKAEDSSERYQQVDALIPFLKPEHYEVDEKNRQALFTDAGALYMEEMLQQKGLITGGLYDMQNISFVHHAEQALRAHKLFTKDVDYIVKSGQVIIIDEFTGRMMDGRRYSEGLHQAIEAKEHVQIQAENQTLATITYQNYFRMYPKLSGMTGTAMTESAELDSTYNLQVIEIPTNRPLARVDCQDEIYATKEGKYTAIIRELEAAHKKQQPVLVGTISIEKSEELAEILRQKTNLRFEVLNARHHEREAYIVAQAGMPGAITIATNMAGRGTDIKLGGNLEMRLKEELTGDETPEEAKEIESRIRKEIEEGQRIVLEAGGLYVLGTERHENRRIDNQLRGRSGRQGDPGKSKFYVSLEDDLMRIFGSERLKGVLKTFHIKEDEVISHPWISRAIQKSQERVEGIHYEIRKTLLKYDDVMTDQRSVIYERRKELIASDDVSDLCRQMRHDVIENAVWQFIPEKTHPDEWNLEGLEEEIIRLVALKLPLTHWVKEDKLSQDALIERIQEISDKMMIEKNKGLTPDMIRAWEKDLVLGLLDQTWKEHLQTLDYLKTAVGLRGYGQKDPLHEYKRDSFVLFSNMLDRLHERVAFYSTHLQVTPPEKEPVKDEQGNVIDFSKVGRNEKCPCGSGKKFKHCHGAI